MNRSRIIRSIITVIFVACSALLLYICIKNSLSIKSTFKLSYKIIYFVVLVFAILFYIVLKRKLNSIGCKKSVEYSYRYIYIVMLILITRFIAVLLYKDNCNLELITPSIEKGLGSYIVYFLGKITLYPLYSTIIVNTLLTFGCAIIIKRLVFNITTNEVLSAIATIGYIFAPQAILNTANYAPYNFNTLFVLGGIYILLKIVDEVKQHKLKTKKYLTLTCFMGICILLDILFGGRFEFWIIVLFSSLVISNNVGYVRVKSKREFVEKFNSINARKLMYKMETITLNKLIIVSSIISGFIVIAIAIVYLFGLDIFEIYSKFDINILYSNVKQGLIHSKNYYIVLLSLIIILDVLGTVLKRKKDTKTTLIKLCTILIALVTSILENGYNASILDAFLILSLILNIGNIYYNRDEKIKLLKAEN